MRRQAVLVLLSMLLAVAGHAATLQESFDRTFEVRPGAQFTLENVNGGVTLHAWDQPRIQVRAQKKVQSSNDKAAQERMAALRIEATPRNGGLDVVTKDPHQDGSLFDWIFAPSVNASVTYDITLPRSMNLDVRNVNGTIHVTDVKGDLKIETTNGRIEMERCGGRVDAETTNGAIRAELFDLANAPMSFETTNGAISLTVPSSFRANLDASTTNGGVRSDLPITTQHFESSALRGSLNGGGAALRMRTTNGAIEIKSAK